MSLPPRGARQICPTGILAACYPQLLFLGVPSCQAFEVPPGHASRGHNCFKKVAASRLGAVETARVVGFYSRGRGRRRTVHPITARTRSRSVQVRRVDPVVESWPSLQEAAGWRLTKRGTWEPIRGKRAAKRKTYATPWGNTAPSLHRVKLEQRKALLDWMDRRGTILELYAGRGNLTRNLYASRAKKLILVDKDPEALKYNYAKLGGHKYKAELHAMDCEQYLEQLDPSSLDDLVLVDFDAFGSPGPAIRKFFEVYKVDRPLLVAITDGGKYYATLHQNAEGRRYMRTAYGVDKVPRDTTRNGMLRTLDKMMENEGRRHGFKVKRISVGANDKQTLYVGYLVTPR